MNKVLEFPKDKIIRDNAPEAEEIKQAKTKGVKNFADSLIKEISENTMNDFDNYGIDTEKKSFGKDFHFFVEALSAAVYRTLNLEHPLHIFIDENVEMIVDETAEV
jgi:hypothetical protein